MNYAITYLEKGTENKKRKYKIKRNCKQLICVVGEWETLKMLLKVNRIIDLTCVFTPLENQTKNIISKDIVN